MPAAKVRLTHEASQRQRDALLTSLYADRHAMIAASAEFSRHWSTANELFVQTYG